MKNNTRKMNGGRIIPKYINTFNDPGVTNEQNIIRKIYEKDNEKMKQIKDNMVKPQEPPKPIVEMKVMDTILGAKDTKKQQQQVYPSATVPMPHPFASPIASTYMVPWNFNEHNTPTIKKYNISIQGATGELTSTGEIFEDILPPSQVTHNRMTTIGERLVLYSYIRSILVKKGDGEAIGFTDTPRNRPEIINLLSYMKMLEINPYHFSRLTNNPYRTMPDNFVMFRSCYPVRLMKSANFLMCAKDSVGANVRIYGMNLFDELANRLNYSGIKKKFSDVWREIMWYQYIREEILKKKICPHFPFLYSYYITSNTGLDFKKLKALKQSYVDKNFEFENSNEIIKNSLFSDTINAMISSDKSHGLVLSKDKMKDYLHTNTSKSAIDKIQKQHKYEYSDDKNVVIFDISNSKIEIDIRARSSKCVVALTEAPNQNIINWSTRSYIIDDGPVRKQLNTGIHDELTWRSVIFQIVVAFYVMDLKKIAIKEMSWSRNIFIKDLDSNNSVGYWKYKIGGFDFYVPNMGSLILIDSCFDDLKDGTTFDNITNGSNIKFKLNADFFGDSEPTIKYIGMDLHVTENDIDTILIDNFKRLFSPNVFSSEFSNYGGIKPPQNIINLLTAIGDANYRDYKNNKNPDDLADVIRDNFKEFLHNKVGKIITETEKPQLYQNGYEISQCKKGELVGITFNDESMSYYWGLYIGLSVDTDDEHAVLTIKTNTSNDTRDLNIVMVTQSMIARVHGFIEQNYKPDHKISSEEELLETYIISF